MDRGERRYRSNRAAKRRICEIRNESWGYRNPEFGWDSNDPFSLDIKHDVIKKSKTRHPYSGDTRRMKEEYLGQKRKIQESFYKDNLSQVG